VEIKTKEWFGVGQRKLNWFEAMSVRYPIMLKKNINYKDDYLKVMTNIKLIQEIELINKNQYSPMDRLSNLIEFSNYMGNTPISANIMNDVLFDKRKNKIVYTDVDKLIKLFGDNIFSQDNYDNWNDVIRGIEEIREIGLDIPFLNSLSVVKGDDVFEKPRGKRFGV